MIVDHYAVAAGRWAHGASLVYRPVAEQLLASSPHLLAGRHVLDAGSGTGVVSAALAGLGADAVAVDLSIPMLAWDAPNRPPALVGDVTRLALRADSVDDTVAAFVYNHLTHPELGLAEAVRVTRPGGAVLACVFANASRSEVRDVLDQAALAQGWRVPDWYVRIKQSAAPLLGTAEDMLAAAQRAGLIEPVVDERPVAVGVTEAEQLVDYRIGQAHFSAWLQDLGPERAAEVRASLVETIRPIMRPYQPIVVFLSARTS